MGADVLQKITITASLFVSVFLMFASVSAVDAAACGYYREFNVYMRICNPQIKNSSDCLQFVTDQVEKQNSVEYKQSYPFWSSSQSCDDFTPNLSTVDEVNMEIRKYAFQITQGNAIAEPVMTLSSISNFQSGTSVSKTFSVEVVIDDADTFEGINCYSATDFCNILQTSGPNVSGSTITQTYTFNTNDVPAKGYTVLFRTDTKAEKSGQVSTNFTVSPAPGQQGGNAQKATACGALAEASCKQNKECFYYNGQCRSKEGSSQCGNLPKNLCGEGTPGNQECVWMNFSDKTGQCLTKLEAGYTKQYDPGNSGAAGRFLPGCAFAGTCRNINDVVEVAVNAARWVLGIIGSIALAVFIYGGFLMIFSMGNSDRVKKGRQAMAAAVLGLVVSFSAFLLVDFVLDALQVSEGFRLIQ